MNEITIRPLTPADLRAVSALETAVYGSGGYRSLSFRQLYDLCPRLMWVAEADSGQVIGHVCGAIAHGGQVGWIMNFAVQAHYRRQGIGRRLVEKGIEQLFAAGVQSITVTAEAENSAAISLYKALGFRQVRREDDYYGDGLERVVFEYHQEEQG